MELAPRLVAMIASCRAGYYPSRLSAGNATAQEKMGLRAWWFSRQADK